MILAVTAVHLGDIALVGLVLVGLGWLWYLGKILIDLTVDRMRRAGEPSWQQREDDAKRLADEGREPRDYIRRFTGTLPRHLAVETEPIDDTQAMAAVDAVTGVGDSR